MKLMKNINVEIFNNNLVSYYKIFEDIIGLYTIYNAKDRYFRIRNYINDFGNVFLYLFKYT